MPNYKFQCPCGHSEELLVPLASRDEPQACPVCSATMQRLFGMPAIQGTDSQYYRGKGTLMNQFRNRHDLNVRLKASGKRGFRPSANDVYEPCLASYPGDPKAFISGGRGQIKRRQEEMRRGEPTDNKVPLAENLVREKARTAIRQNPELAHLPKGKLRERILEKHGAKH